MAESANPATELSSGSCKSPESASESMVVSLNASEVARTVGGRVNGAKRNKYPLGPLFFIMGTAVGQSYSATGLQAVLELYFVRFLYVCSGKKRASSLSSTSVNVFIAVYELCALSAGFLADRVLGNFATQNFSNIVTSIGICLMAFASWQFTLEEPHCCLNANSTTGLVFSDEYNCSVLLKDRLLTQVNLHIPPALNLTLAIAGLLLFAVGYGHTNAIQSVFVADQFREEESKAKERSFSWYYLWENVGTLLGEGGMPVLRQTVGFVITLLTVVGATLVSTVLFMAGSCVYVKKKPQHRIQCNCNCQRRGERGETQPLLSNEKQISVQHRVSIFARWRQFIPFAGVFGPLVIFWAIFYQQNSTWILQGTQMDCYLGKLHIPPDFMPSLEDLLVVVMIPLLDYLVIPHLERTMRIKVLPLHKLVAGMISAALSFLMAGLLQLYVRHYTGGDTEGDCHGDVNIVWQLVQLVFIALAEVLVSITGLEFAYSQAPPDLRNFITALWSISQALGTLLNAGVAQIPMSLTYEFFVYLVLMVLVTILFIVINRNYRYRDRRDRKLVLSDT